MKTFRVTYIMEVFIDADTKEQAQEIFENTMLDELQPSYVEQTSIEQEEK